MHPLADILREVTVSVRQALASGHRSRQIEAGDLIEVLLTIADRLDPPVMDRLVEHDDLSEPWPAEEPLPARPPD